MAMPPLLAMLLVFGALAAACSSDDDADTGDSSPDATATEPADDGDGGGSDEGDAGDGGDDGDDGAGGFGAGSGRATLTIGDESWTFDGVFCAFSPEESQNERVSFTLTSSGESADGVRIFLDATIQDPDRQGRYDGEDVIKTVSLNDVEDFENPSLDWSSISGFSIAELDFQVSGKNVTVAAAFNDGRTDEIETVPGTLTATCP